jgi:hypothetical protein
LCVISCAISCKSQMRFAVSAISCPTRITFYLLLVQQIAHQIACATPNRSCDTKSHLRFGLLFGVITQPFPTRIEIEQQIATQYRMLRVNGSNSVSDTKSQMLQIYSKFTANRTLNHTRETSPLAIQYDLNYSISTYLSLPLSFIY